MLCIWWGGSDGELHLTVIPMTDCVYEPWGACVISERCIIREAVSRCFLTHSGRGASHAFTGFRGRWVPRHWRLLSIDTFLREVRFLSCFSKTAVVVMLRAVWQGNYFAARWLWQRVANSLYLWWNTRKEFGLVHHCHDEVPGSRSSSRACFVLESSCCGEQ